MASGRITSRQRLSSAALLLLHVSVAGLSPLADASVEWAAQGPVHVESENRTACPPGHDHLLCQWCRQLDTRLFVPLALGRAPQDFLVRPTDRPLEPSFTPAASLCLPLGSRAPPIA